MSGMSISNSGQQLRTDRGGEQVEGRKVVEVVDAEYEAA